MALRLSASKPIKEFLGKLKEIRLSGRLGFAFNTKLDSRFSGSAAKFIEKERVSEGFKIIAPRESGIIYVIKDKGAIVGANLKEGEEKRFELVGTRIGTASAQSLGSTGITG